MCVFDVLKVLALKKARAQTCLKSCCLDISCRLLAGSASETVTIGSPGFLRTTGDMKWAWRTWSGWWRNMPAGENQQNPFKRVVGKEPHGLGDLEGVWREV